MNKSFWAILGVVLLALVGIFMLSGGKADDINTGEFAYVDPIAGVQEFDHKSVSSENEATVTNTIVEYGDFQCPACGALFPILEQIKQTYGNSLNVVFRHNPLSQIHPQAMAAHRAAEAAARQGQFWEMHDQLYISQQQWSGRDDAVSIFEGYAEQLGLDMDQYRNDIGSDSVFSRINSDLESGTNIGVSSTPTLFLNGELLDSVPTNLAEWQAVLGDPPAQN